VSFWDNYEEVGGNFVSGNEKKVLIDNGIPFDITAITHRDEGKFGPEWMLSVLVPNAETGDPEERTMCFQSGNVGSRDDMLRAAKAYLDGDEGAPITVKLEMNGRSQLLRSAE
jgi:hypothetical protein